MSRIAATFSQLQAQGRKALIPFVTAGFPYADVTPELMHAMVAGGADVIELGDQLPGARAGIQRKTNLAESFAARRAFATQRLQTQNAAFVARPARLNAFPDPDFFLLPELVELTVLRRLHFQLFRFPDLICREIALIRAQLAAIQFDDAIGDAVKKRAVVGDEQQRADKLGQLVFQPFDGVEIKVVGRLVEQQQFRLGSECPRQRDPLLVAAGKRLNQRIGRQVEAGDDFLHPAIQTPDIMHFEFVRQASQLGHRVAFSVGGFVRGGMVSAQ